VLETHILFVHCDILLINEIVSAAVRESGLLIRQRTTKQTRLRGRDSQDEGSLPP
jgi:hypothetical protein